MAPTQQNRPNANNVASIPKYFPNDLSRSNLTKPYLPPPGEWTSEDSIILFQRLDIEIKKEDLHQARLLDPSYDPQSRHAPIRPSLPPAPQFQQSREQIFRESVHGMGYENDYTPALHSEYRDPHPEQVIGFGDPRYTFQAIPRNDNQLLGSYDLPLKTAYDHGHSSPYLAPAPALMRQQSLNPAIFTSSRNSMLDNSTTVALSRSSGGKYITKATLENMTVIREISCKCFRLLFSNPTYTVLWTDFWSGRVKSDPKNRTRGSYRNTPG